ncbi:MAG: hypothetical protein Q9173_004898 [Seirophora scorigena]
MPSIEASSYLKLISKARSIVYLEDIGYPVGITRPIADLNDANSVSFFRYDIPVLIQFQTIISETPAKGSINATLRNSNSTAILNECLTADTRTMPSSTHASTPLTDDTLRSNLCDGLEVSNHINMHHSMSAGNRPSYSSDPRTDPVKHNHSHQPQMSQSISMLQSVPNSLPPDPRFPSQGPAEIIHSNAYGDAHPQTNPSREPWSGYVPSQYESAQGSANYLPYPYQSLGPWHDLQAIAATYSEQT